MSYLSAKFSYKIKKVFRYVQIYGISRTYVKVLGQLYMGERYKHPLLRLFRFWYALKLKLFSPKGPRVAFIGLGNFSFSTLAFYARRGGASLVAAYDLDPARTEFFSSVYGTKACRTVDELVGLNLDLVFIASNHSSHTFYAQKCLAKGISVHVEKPISTTLEQTIELYRLMNTMKAQVFTGYNRPLSKLFGVLKSYYCEQPGPGTLNWFIAGHEIDPDHWYFSPEEGGRVLGNLCHWLDLCVELVPKESLFPITISTTASDWLGSDFLVNLKFGDKSVASLTFSAKGHTFEGVRERLNVHRGDFLGYLADFSLLEIDVGSTRRRVNLSKRDHGHKANVMHSLTLKGGEFPDRVMLTSLIALAVNSSIKQDRPVVLDQAGIDALVSGESSFL